MENRGPIIVDLDPQVGQDNSNPPPPDATISTPIAASFFQYNSITTGNIESSTSEQKRKLLGCIDSIHDFDDEDGRVSAESWPLLNDLLRQSISVYNGIEIQTPAGEKSKTTYSKWLSGVTDRKVTSASTVEEQTVQYYENDDEFLYVLNTPSTKTMTYRTILNKIRDKQNAGSEINTAIYEAGNELFVNYETTGVLDVNMEPDEDWDFSYSPEEKTYLGLFFLNFFFPPSSTAATTDVDENTRIPSYITFDAGSNIPSKIFGLLDQVVHLVTPLNIADSALGESHLLAKTPKRSGVKNHYKFPVNYGDSTFMYTSNIYTKDKYRLYIRMPPGEYEEKTRYNFKVSILPVTPPVIELPREDPALNMEFDLENKSGPSVTYLADMVSWKNGGQRGDAPSAERKMVNIESLVRQIPSADTNLLLDIKRSGDWEQCNAAAVISKEENSVLKNRVILCTIDRLCALYSRLQGQNTIWHYGTRLKLYRYPGALTEEERRAILVAQQNAKAAADAESETIITKLKTAILGRLPTLEEISLSGIPKGFKTSTPFDEWFLYLSRNMLHITAMDLSGALRIDDINDFFQTVSKITGQSINRMNYQPFVDSITSFTEMKKIVFGYYDYNALSYLKEVFSLMYKFVEGSRQSRAFTIKNYNEELKSNGFFSILENIAGVLAPQKPDISALLLQFHEIEYNSVNPYDYAEANRQYYLAFKERIGILLNPENIEIIKREKPATAPLLPPPPLLTSQSLPNLRFGGSNEKEKENIMENTRNELVDEFVILSASLTEIAEAIVRPRMDLSGIDFDKFIEMFTMPSTTLLNEEEIYDVKRAVLDFLENGYNAVNQMQIDKNTQLGGQPKKRMASQDERPRFKPTNNSIRTIGADLNDLSVLPAEDKTAQDAVLNLHRFKPRTVRTNTIFTNNRTKRRADTIKRIEEERQEKRTGNIESRRLPNPITRQYLDVCLFLSALYYQPTDDVDKAIEAHFYSGKNTWRNETPEGPHYLEFKQHILEYNREYLTEDYILVSGNDINDTHYFLIQYCITLKKQGVPPENILLMVFVFFQNFFKFVIKEKGETVPFSNTEYGYYPGILTTFHTNAEVDRFFGKLNILNMKLPRENIENQMWEFSQNKNIFANFSVICFHLLAYVYDKNAAKRTVTELNRIKGGKKTRRKYPKKVPKRKTRGQRK